MSSLLYESKGRPVQGFLKSVLIDDLPTVWIPISDTHFPCSSSLCSRDRRQVLYDKVGAIHHREITRQGYRVEHIRTLMLWRLEYFLLMHERR